MNQGISQSGSREKQRVLSVAVLSLYSSWMLSFTFQGELFTCVGRFFHYKSDTLVHMAVAAQFVGLLTCGLYVRSYRAARWAMFVSALLCIAGTSVFFFPPSPLWTLMLPVLSLLAGSAVGSWGYLFKYCTPASGRFITAADGLIGSNLLMLLLNMLAAYVSPFTGLAASMLMLAGSAVLVLRLPAAEPAETGEAEAVIKIKFLRSLLLLCLFIVLITVNSGLMYQVVNPAYTHLDWLVGWYWAAPYIAALLLLRLLPVKINRTYMLYAGIAMIGFSFLSFMSLDRSAASYIAVDTLMLASCGVYDLFWWSILGEMLTYAKNPALVLGAGLAANVLGVLLGGAVGNVLLQRGADVSGSPSIVALAVVCAAILVLPILHKRLSLLLKNHVYLKEYPVPMKAGKKETVFLESGCLTGREKEIAVLLVQGKTYRMIAGELQLSENTVKSHVKNIYSKMSVQSRAELINRAIVHNGVHISGE